MDYKERILAVNKAGLRNEDVASFIGVSVNAVINWRRKKNPDKPSEVNQRKIIELYDFVAGVGAIKEIDWKEVVERLVDRISMDSLMRALELRSERTVRRWIDGKAIPGSRRSIIILMAFQRAFFE